VRRAERRFAVKAKACSLFGVLRDQAKYAFKHHDVPLLWSVHWDENADSSAKIQPLSAPFAIGFNAFQLPILHTLTRSHVAERHLRWSFFVGYIDV